jgi:hypothetical protein
MFSFDVVFNFIQHEDFEYENFLIFDKCDRDRSCKYIALIVYLNYTLWSCRFQDHWIVDFVRWFFDIVYWNFFCLFDRWSQFRFLILLISRSLNHCWRSLFLRHRSLNFLSFRRFLVLILCFDHVDVVIIELLISLIEFLHLFVERWRSLFLEHRSLNFLSFKRFFISILCFDHVNLVIIKLLISFVESL